MPVSPTIEEYLEAIYLMTAEGRPAIGARLAEQFAVSAPTVTATMKRMQRDGYVASDARGIWLTTLGRELAEGLVRRHRLSERLLTDILGLDWHTSHAEACRLEHAISPAVEERLATVLGNPTTCPHGNPIPGTAERTCPSNRGEFLLSEAAPGQTVWLRRISEEAELDAALLAHFDRMGLRPGARLEVRDTSAVNGTATFLVEGEAVTLGLQAAGRVWVSEDEPSQ